MHKRRQRGLTAKDIEEVRRALEQGDWEALDEVSKRLERRAEWDEQYPTGEGEVDEPVRFRGPVERVSYQWVRVTNAKGRVLGTFYIRHHDGEVLELFIAPARKGVPPNPYDRSLMSQVGWRKDNSDDAQEWQKEQARRAAMTADEREHHMSAELERNREELERCRRRAENDPRYAEFYPEDAKYLSEEVERIQRDWGGEVRRDTRPLNTDSSALLGSTGLSEAHKVKGQRPTTGVQPVTDLDGDVRFQFRDGKSGFSARGSKLGSVLLGFRRAGYQQVTLEMVQAAIEHVAQTGSMRP